MSPLPASPLFSGPGTRVRHARSSPCPGSPSEPTTPPSETASKAQNYGEPQYSTDQPNRSPPSTSSTQALGRESQTIIFAGLPIHRLRASTTVPKVELEISEVVHLRFQVHACKDPGQDGASPGQV